jgi:outer membrane protein OmpA-like peptidoglycan-associated protein
VLKIRGGNTMRQIRSALLLTMAFALLGALPAAAQSSQVSDAVAPSAGLKGEFYFGPFIGYSFVGDHNFRCKCDVMQENYIVWGGRLGYMVTDHLGLEASGGYLNLHPSFWELSTGALWDFTPTQHGWNPYASAGVGASREKVFKGKGTFLAYLAGGAEYRFNKNVGMRLELKGQYNAEAVLYDRFGAYTNPSRVDVQPSIGALFRFGGSPAPIVVVPAPAPPAPAPAPPPPPPPPAPPETPKAPEPVVAPPPVVPPPPPPPARPREPITFDREKFAVNNIAKAQLDDVALKLRESPRSNAIVTGYADGRSGSAAEKLARRRAENVKQYLITRHKIDAARITVETSLDASGAQAIVTIVSPR